MGGSKKIKRKLTKWSFGLVVAGLIVILCMPRVTFEQPYSKAIYASDGSLLGATTAADGQWRFHEMESLPALYEMCLLAFEDKRYHQHLGVDLRAVIRAFRQNIKHKKVVSGASTITMQVCRMSRGDKPRTLLNKLLEMGMALKLEITNSKTKILRLHSSHAPYGGNVVGIEAASWRYFSKPPQLLTLAESAVLAVLPNAPSLMHPGKNRDKLKAKRDRLLQRMHEQGLISDHDHELALLEELPHRPRPLPRLAPHLLDAFTPEKGGGYRITTTIDRHMQETAMRTATLFSEEYAQSDIHNLGILILDTQSGATLAYVGNSPTAQTEKDVDMVTAPRSSGSVLKPFLHAAALDEGLMSPKGLLLDVPSDYSGYKPKNYDGSYDGAVPAHTALARSLNVPYVEMLKEYDTHRALEKFRQLQITSLNKPASHYGLSLILGGGEVSLWELTGAYASMARILTRYKREQSRYVAADVREPHLRPDLDQAPAEYSYYPTVLSAAAIHHTFEAMKSLSRPDEEGQWETFGSSREIAWKTGTSFGHRDAWAVGVSPRYTIGVWVGNSDGEGKHSLIGVRRAGPVLFDLYNQLDHPGHFECPYDDLVLTEICAQSGHPATMHCSEQDTIYQIEQSTSLKCPYHISLTVDEDDLRVHSDCYSPSQMEKKSHFVLPADAAYYYRQRHPEYEALPRYRPGCEELAEGGPIQFIYPKKSSRLFLPESGDGEKETAIFRAAHVNPEATLHWHLDERYLGLTVEEHTMSVQAATGKHALTVVDAVGNSLVRRFEVVGEP